MLRTTIVAVRSICFLAAAILAAWQFWMLARWDTLPWPSALWLVALLATIAASVRPPSGRLVRLGLSALFIVASITCGVMWQEELPTVLIVLFLAPLGLGLAVVALPRNLQLAQDLGSEAHAG